MAKKPLEKMPRKEQKVEKQAMIILFVVVAIIAAIFTIYFVGPMVKKPYYDFHGFKVYKVALAGTDMMFYNIPDVNFTVQGLTYQKNVVVRTDPLELEKMNISIDVSNKFFRTIPDQMWIGWDDGEKATIYEAELEVKKFVNNLNIPVGIIPANVSFNCANASDERRIVILRSNNTITNRYENFIYANTTYPNCVTIASNSYENLIKSSDKFVIEWLLRISE